MKIKLENWRKVESMEYRESQKKTNEGQWMRLQEIENIHNSEDYKVQNTQTICISLSTRLKEHPSESPKGTKPRSGQCRQWYARKRTREEISALKKRIKVDKADLEIDGAKLCGRSKKR